MNAFYTKVVSDELTKSLDEMGMPVKSQEFPGGRIVVYNPTYAEVFDWLLSKGYSVEIFRKKDDDDWEAFVTAKPSRSFYGKFPEWTDAAEAVIYHAICMMED